MPLPNPESGSSLFKSRPELHGLAMAFQQYYARNQMAWLLEEGDDISALEPTSRSIKQTFDRHGPMRAPEDEEILQTNVFPPPTRWETIIDPDALPKFTNRIGRVDGELLYRCEMTCSGESVGFAIYRDGKKEGSKSVKVDYNTR
ncbi:hypothetical protein B0T09DRAFT_398856 [Sordaria sp. MPI-SDFR-AT-0083]|nr:hypothetical protein B0T09DRAFT_398856 [Sordaria sp. MPI-SDFR-AT-0083]